MKECKDTTLLLVKVPKSMTMEQLKEMADKHNCIFKQVLPNFIDISQPKTVRNVVQFKARMVDNVPAEFLDPPPDNIA